MNLERLRPRIFAFFEAARCDMNFLRDVSSTILRASIPVFSVHLLILKIHLEICICAGVDIPGCLCQVAVVRLASLLADALALRSLVLGLGRLDEVRVCDAGGSLCLLREEDLVDKLGLLLLLPEFLQHPPHTQALRRELVALVLA